MIFVGVSAWAIPEVENIIAATAAIPKIILRPVTSILLTWLKPSRGNSHKNTTLTEE